MSSSVVTGSSYGKVAVRVPQEVRGVAGKWVLMEGVLEEVGEEERA